jgi:uncharacterized protein YbjT (DUF2867 family)
MVTPQQHCLVTGATGYIGGRLVPRLLHEGYRVRVLARDLAKLESVPWRDHVEVVRGDLGDADSMATVCDGIDVLYYLVHSMGTTKDFVSAESRAARNLVVAARAAGVRRLIYLGGLHPPGVRLSPHLRSRKAVGDALLASGIETVVLQAGVVVGSGSASFEMIRHLTDRLPVMTTPKWVHNKIQPIAVCDVLHYLTAAAAADVPCSRSWDIGGPEVLEYGDMMRIYAQIAELGPRHLIVLPFLTPTIASLWVGAVTPIPPGLARPLIDSLECDAVMRNRDIDGIIDRPAAGMTDYRRAVALALSRANRGLVDPCWESSNAAPAEPLPNDPDWAGAIVYTDVRDGLSSVPVHRLWGAIERLPASTSGRRFPLTWRPKSTRHWAAVEVQHGTLLRLRSHAGVPGTAWLELTATAGRTGSRYRQRAIFFPRGLVGRLYWNLGRPLHHRALQALVHNVIEAAGSGG